MATTKRSTGRQALRDGGGVLLLALVLFSVRVSDVPAVTDGSPDDTASPSPAAQQVLAMPAAFRGLEPNEAPPEIAVEPPAAAAPLAQADDEVYRIRWEQVTREANRWLGVAEERLADEHPELQRRLKQVRKFVTFVETTHAEGAACPNEPTVRDAIRTTRRAIRTVTAEASS